MRNGRKLYKKKKSTKPKTKEQQKESQHYRELIDYVCELYGISAPHGIMLRQISDFKRDYDFTYKGMQLTLYFFHEIEGNDINEGGGIGIIPFVYHRATEFYRTRQELRKNFVSRDRENLETRHYKSRSAEDFRTKNEIDMDNL